MPPPGRVRAKAHPLLDAGGVAVVVLLLGLFVWKTACKTFQIPGVNSVQ
jgi:hypothetical protein